MSKYNAAAKHSQWLGEHIQTLTEDLLALQARAKSDRIQFPAGNHDEIEAHIRHNEEAIATATKEQMAVDFWLLNNRHIGHRALNVAKSTLSGAADGVGFGLFLGGVVGIVSVTKALINR